MTKWEYKTKRVPTSSKDYNIEEYLNEQGKDGWELCSISEPFGSHNVFFFKRAIK